MAMTPSQPELPPQLVLYHLATGHYISRALSLAAELKLADLLAQGPSGAHQLADATGTHADSLNRVMRLLATAGVFDERADGSFGLNPLGEALRTGVPGSAHAMVRLFAGRRIQDAWSELEHCVRSGEPVFRKRGLDDPFRDPARTPEETAIFDEAMADLTRLTAVAVAASYDLGPFRFLVDVGGGNGALLIGLLEATPHLRGIVSTSPRPRSAPEPRSPPTGWETAARRSAATSSRTSPTGPTPIS